MEPPEGIKPSCTGLEGPVPSQRRGRNFWLKAKLLKESNPCCRMNSGVLSTRRNSLPINHSAKCVKDSLLAKVVAATYS